ncbi:unnamed protein product [Dovyalis caffra]|uniref:Uncharacterized protein n=1 Tax=Dovyalis caffra TaxID=77055 RepID=A0AAV1S978_9ROSI|nr:unnamed protein product [Dovyalis caffra]
MLAGVAFGVIGPCIYTVDGTMLHEVKNFKPGYQTLGTNHCKNNSCVNLKEGHDMIK